MSRAEWELVEMARARALADRYEREALEAAAAHGCVGVQAQQAYALGWLAMRCADRQVRLEAESLTRRVCHTCGSDGPYCHAANNQKCGRTWRKGGA